MVGPPIALSDTPMREAASAPSLGADAEALLSELGYDGAAIQSLRDDEVI